MNKVFSEAYRIITGTALCNLKNMRIVLNHLGKINTFIDIGANTGQFTKVAKKLIPNAKMIVFEPCPNVYPFANEKDIEFYNFGLSNKK